LRRDGGGSSLKNLSGIVVTAHHDRQSTLANLRARHGLHRVPRRRRTEWFPFQGTISVDEDTREVLRARRIPVYLNDPGH